MVPRTALRILSAGAGALFLLWVGVGNPYRHSPTHRSEHLAVGGIQYRALRAGQGDTTLLLLHGYGESLLTWRLVIDRLATRYRILAVDLPGFGLSDKPAAAYDYQTFEEWLGKLLAEQTSGPVVVVGHSMGGQLAAGLALAHPERVAAAVLIAPAGAGINRLLSDSGGIASPSTQWVAAAVSFVLPVHDSAWLSESPADLAYRPSQDSTAARAARQTMSRFDFAAIGERYRQLRQPVLLIWGREDPTVPFEIGQRVAEMLPCRRFVPLTALHRPHQTEPDTVVAEMVRFLHAPRCEDKR